MKKLLFILIVLWGGGAAGVWYWNDVRSQHVSFRTVTVRRGDLLATINATGTLEPEEVVDVGVQIAGEIQSFGKDPRDPGKPISYGSPVEQGTVLARLDDSLFKARVDSGQGQPRQGRGRRAPGAGQAPAGRARLRAGQQALQARNRSRRRSTTPPLATYETAKAALAVAESCGRAGRGQPRGGERQPRLHHDPLAGQGRDPRPPGEHRPDGGGQPERAQPVPDRQGPEPDGDLGLGQRDRRRPDPRRPGGPVHRRRLPARDLPRQGLADPAQRQHDAERRHLHGGRRRRQHRRASSCPT